MNTAETTAIAPRSSRILAGRNGSPLLDLATSFAATKRPNLKAIERFKEVFYALIFKTTISERKIIGASLAKSYYTPRSAALFLAMEEIAVAAPTLLFSPVLNTRDLNVIISKTTFRHACVIARRIDLEFSTVRMLLAADNENEEIRNLIKRNVCVNNKQDVIDLLKIPSSEIRAEMEFQRAQDLLQNKTGESVEVSVPPLPVEVNHRVTNDMKDKSSELMELANIGGRLSQNLESFTLKGGGKSSRLSQKEIESQLVSHANDQDLEGLAASLQQFTGLQRAQTQAITQSGDAGLIASLLASLKVSRRTASQLLLLLNKDVGRNAEIFNVVMDKYTQLNTAECEAIFRKMGANFPHATSGKGRNGLPEEISTFNSVMMERRRNMAIGRPSDIRAVQPAKHRLVSNAR